MQVVVWKGWLAASRSPEASQAWFSLLIDDSNGPTSRGEGDARGIGRTPHADYRCRISELRFGLTLRRDTPGFLPALEVVAGQVPA